MDNSILYIPFVSNPQFLLGTLIATPDVLARIDREDIRAALIRHSHGDWGILSDEDVAANDMALEEGTRLFSIYASRFGIRFWIITEADRSHTTIVLPEEYG